MKRNYPSRLAAFALLLLSVSCLDAATIDRRLSIRQSDIGLLCATEFTDPIHTDSGCPEIGGVKLLGLSQLPVRHIDIDLPRNSTGIRMSVEYAVEDTVSGKFLIDTRQPQPSLDNIDNARSEAYILPPQQTNNPFPGKTAEILDIRNEKGRLIVHIAVYPIQFWSADSSLTLMRTVGLKLEYSLQEERTKEGELMTSSRAAESSHWSLLKGMKNELAKK